MQLQAVLIVIYFIRENQLWDPPPPPPVFIDRDPNCSQLGIAIHSWRWQDVETAKPNWNVWAFRRGVFCKLFLHAHPLLSLFRLSQGVTKRCRLSWLANSSLVYERKCGGGMRGLSQWAQLWTWSPINLWWSNSIFNLWSLLFPPLWVEVFYFTKPSTLRSNE